MATPSLYELEHEVLPEVRKAILQIEDWKTQQALFGLLALVHDLAIKAARDSA